MEEKFKKDIKEIIENLDQIGDTHLKQCDELYDLLDYCGTDKEKIKKEIDNLYEIVKYCVNNAIELRSAKSNYNDEIFNSYKENQLNKNKNLYNKHNDLYLKYDKFINDENYRKGLKESIYKYFEDNSDAVTQINEILRLITNVENKVDLNEIFNFY